MGGTVAGDGDSSQWEDVSGGGVGREATRFLEGLGMTKGAALDRGSCRAYISGMIFASSLLHGTLWVDWLEAPEFTS